MTTTYVQLTTPVGPLVIGGDDHHLTEIFLPNHPNVLAGARRSEDVDDRQLSGPLTDARRQLGEYFSGERRTFGLPLQAAGTPFQLQVWFALADIPYGETISYAELACRVGRPRAFRAVGQANGANPLPIVLPCHRVVASGGGIGGYGGGLDLKRQLLAIEASGRR